MHSNSQHRCPASCLLLTGLVVAVVGFALTPADRPARAQAQPPATVPPELQLVPADAAIFAYVDAAQVWGGPLLKTIREADPKLFDELTGMTRETFGATPEMLQSAVVYFPRLKAPGDLVSFGVALTFARPFDKAKLQAGFDKVKDERVKVTLHTPSDRRAIVLVGLDDEYARPRKGGDGPLTPAIRAAASGKHTLVAGATLASLPDEIRGDDLPASVRPFQSLLRAEAIWGTIDLGKELVAEVRVKAATPAQAGEAENALGLLASLAAEGLGEGVKELDKEAHKDPLLKDLLAIMKAVQGGVKGARFATDGSETRAAVRVPADLPYGTAFVGAVQKVRQAAARVKSSNNLKQIALALHNYHDAHEAFPPAAVVDKTGKPLLSWRVLILPYIEQEALYKEFKLDEPWDSEHNKKLLARMPPIYVMPGEEGRRGDAKTYYRVFVGNGALFDTIRGTKITEITDGTSNTAMVVTAAEAVPWSKPDELPFDPDKDMTKLIGTLPSGDVCMMAFGDGSVRAIRKTIKKDTLHAIITRAGGEVIVDDFE